MTGQIFNPDTMPKDDTFEADVCIIGSGSGGAIAAAKISATGRSIIMLEKGSYLTSKDFNQDSRTLVPEMYVRSAGLATDDMSIRILAGQTWGGSTTINWMTSLRTPKNVLEQWADQYGLKDYAPEHMEAYFEEVEQRLNVHKVAEEDHSPPNRIILDAAGTLGIHAEALPNNSDGCIGCGTCGLGCPYDAKMDMRLTYLDDAVKNGMLGFTEVRAERIDYMAEDKQVIYASVMDKSSNTVSREIKISAKRTIVAGSAISTPLILQKSKLTKGGNVGKYLQLHPVGGLFAEFDRPMNPTYGIPQSAVSHEYHNLDGQGYGFWVESPDLEPFLAGVSGPGFGRERRELLKNLTHSSALIMLVRDGANHKSNGEIRLRRGLNLQNGSFNLKKIPSIRYKICKQDMKHYIEGIVNMAEIFFASGAKRVFTLNSDMVTLNSKDEIPKLRELKYGPNHIGKFSAHPMGTARMAADPKISVVDHKMEMHHYPGMFVMDGSTLPTALGVNPMITILGCVSRAIDLGDW